MSWVRSSFFVPLTGLQPPVNLVTQNFAGMILNTQSAGVAPSPRMNTIMGCVGMPPTITTGNMGMDSVGIGGVPTSQGLIGMNMAPVGLSLQGGHGMPVMGVGQGINPAVLQPKQDAFANFGNFGKWKNARIL